MPTPAGGGTGDQLATVSDLQSALGNPAGFDTDRAQLLIECATATVQAITGQRIVEVIGDVVTLLGTTDSYLDLPEIPVTAVSSVTIDGITKTLSTDYKVLGNRLWSRSGWQSNYGFYGGEWRPSYAHDPYFGPEPSTVVVTYTHGYPAGDQRLQLARSAVLTLASPLYNNPGGVSSESIDDYTVQYASTQAAMEAAAGQQSHLTAALRRQYGRRGGLVRIG